MNEPRVSRTWRDVLDPPDRDALLGYARVRPPYVPGRAALLVIDVTENFVGPDLPVVEAQSMFRQACGERAWRALPQISHLIDRFRNVELPVIFTVPDSNQRWLGAATRGDVSNDVDSHVNPVLAPHDSDPVIVKAKASAFFATGLVSGLIRDRVDTVVLTGGTTSGCVRATAVDATSYGLEVLVPDDAVFDRVELGHLVALNDIDTKYGRVQSTVETLDLLGVR